MKRAIFIQSNSKQILGAKLAKYAIERFSHDAIPVHIMRVEEYPEFAAFGGATYLKSGTEITYIPSDLQSFTLSRFKPPELMGYEGEALVIDPDIFALHDITRIFDLPRGGKPILACKKKDAWDSSVMVLDCARLTNWKVSDFMEQLKSRAKDYTEYSTLAFENGNVAELSRDWNSLDVIKPETHFLHTTNRLTQPWKTGLPIDFTRNPLGKKFGIPREWLYKLVGRYPSRYQPHPDAKVESFFFKLANEALSAGAITQEDVDEGIASDDLRPDFRKQFS